MALKYGDVEDGAMKFSKAGARAGAPEKLAA